MSNSRDDLCHPEFGSSSCLSPRDNNSSIQSGLDYEKEQAGTMSLLGGSDKKAVLSPKSPKSPIAKILDRSPLATGSVASVGTRRKLFETCRQVMMKAKSRGRGQLLASDDEDEGRKRSKSRHQRDNKEKKERSSTKSRSTRKDEVEEDTRSKSRHRSSRHNDGKKDKELRQSTKSSSSSRHNKENDDSSRRFRNVQDEEAEDKSSTRSRRVSDDSTSRSKSRHRHEEYGRSESRRRVPEDDRRRNRSPSRKSKSRRDIEEEDTRYHNPSKSRRDRSPSGRNHSPSQHRSKSRHRREEEKQEKSSRSRSRHDLSERDGKDRSLSRRSKSRHRTRDEETKDRSRSSKSSRHLTEREHRHESPSKSSTRGSHKHIDEFALSPSRSGRHLSVNSDLYDSQRTSLEKEISLTPTKSQRHLEIDKESKSRGHDHHDVHKQTEHSSSAKSSKSKSSRRISVGSDDNTCSTSTISSKSSSSKKIRITQQEYIELKESIQRSRRASQKDILARLQSKRRLSKSDKEAIDSIHDLRSKDQERERDKDKRRDEKSRSKDKERRSRSKGKEKSRHEATTGEAEKKISSDSLDHFMQMRLSKSSDSSSPSTELMPGFEIVVHPDPAKETQDDKSRPPDPEANAKAFWETEPNPSPSPKSNEVPNLFTSPRSKRITMSPRVSLSPSKLKISEERSPRKAQSCRTLMVSDGSPRRAHASLLLGSKPSPRKEQSARTLQSRPISPRLRQKKRHTTLGMLSLAINEDDETIVPASPNDSNAVAKEDVAAAPVARPGLARNSSWRAPSVGSTNFKTTESKDTSPRRPSRPSLQRSTSWRPPTDLNDLDQEMQMKRSESVRLPVNQPTATTGGGRRQSLARTSSWRPPSVREGPSRRMSEGLERHERILEKPRAVYTEEDIFTSYTWSLTRQDFYKVQKERLLLKDSIRDTALFRAYQKIVAVC